MRNRVLSRHIFRRLSWVVFPWPSASFIWLVSIEFVLCVGHELVGRWSDDLPMAVTALSAGGLSSLWCSLLSHSAIYSVFSRITVWDFPEEKEA